MGPVRVANIYIQNNSSNNVPDFELGIPVFQEVVDLSDTLVSLSLGVNNN